jgi:hypothetical protein
MRQLFYPLQKKLKRCIRYISFYESGDDEREFLVFPNPGSAIALGPIAEYLKNFGVEWDSKAFKKQQDQTDSKITRLLKGDTD